MDVSLFDFELPEDRIALRPAIPRDAARMLVVHAEGRLEHRHVRDLPEYLGAGDALLLNDTKVIPARLEGTKETGGRCELLLCEPLPAGPAGPGERFRAMGQASKPIRAGQRLDFGALSAVVEAVEGDGFLAVRFDRAGAAFAEALERVGHMPLPPYIRRPDRPIDRERYQTVFAREPGSVAAPTAGLHFTPELLSRLEVRGLARARVTLHVGPGTFLPVRERDLTSHRMHEEAYQVPEATAAAFHECRRTGGRVVAVGSTAARTLESALAGDSLRTGAGRTSLFVVPGYQFRAVDALVTNLHLPRSTLLMLVCAFAGRERVLAAYAEAVAERYRFFSYGDAMLIA